MKTSRHEVLFLSLLASCVLATAAAFGEQARAEKMEQRRWLAAFYQAYLQPRIDPAQQPPMPPRSFYSDSAEALIAGNEALCATLPRDDRICGFGADGDVFLNSQETDPQLSFASAGVTLRSAAPNVVDVTFNVYPAYGADGARTIRYVLVKQDNGWRVDDMLYMDDKGGFPPAASMRKQIGEENAAVLNDAADFAQANSAVFNFLRNTTTLDRAERFVRFPLTLCRRDGACHVLARNDARLRDALLALQKAYYRGEEDDSTNFEGVLPTTPYAGALPGTTVQFDVFGFTFAERAWWITKIDLRRLGSAVPLQSPQH